VETQLPQVVAVTTHGYDALRAEIRAGELIRLRPGAYVPASSANGPEWERRRRTTLARCVAVADKLTTPFAFSGVTAALLHGWAVPMYDDSVHVVQMVNPGTGCTSDVIRHVCGSLESQGVVLVNGLPVTGHEQTILACARGLRPHDALVVVDSALGAAAQMSRFRRPESEERQAELRAALERRLSTMGAVRGVRSAREVIALADGFADNPSESRMRWIALAAGLPEPICQYELWVDGRQYFADAVWSGEGAEGPWLVVAEFDGAIKYRGQDGPDAVVEEKVREDAIRRRHHARFVRLDTPTLRRPELALRQMLEVFPAGSVPPLRPRRLLQVRPPRRDR